MTFRRLIMMLWVSLSLMIMGVIFIGRAHPTPEGLAMLHLDMCAPPCWIGIRPGVTTLAEADTQIDNVFPSSHFRVSGSTGTYMIQDVQNGNLAFSVQLDDKAALITSIGLSFGNPSFGSKDSYINATSVKVADLNAMWGNPQGIWVSPCYSMNRVWSPQYQLTANTVFNAKAVRSDPNWIVSWNSPVETMEMFSDGVSILPAWEQWRGFMTFRKYGYDSSLAGC